MQVMQGLQASDPYKTLHVAPHAPRALIDEAYWTLASAANGAGAAASHARLQALNDAYALLTDDERRAQYDEEHGHARPKDAGRQRRRGLFGRGGGKHARAGRTLYAALGVDVEASSSIITVAYNILSRAPHSAEERAEIEAAYRTLANRELRAQYDQKLPVQKPQVAREPTEPSASAPETVEEPRGNPEPLSSPPVADMGAADWIEDEQRTSIIRPAMWSSGSAANIDEIALPGTAPAVVPDAHAELQDGKDAEHPTLMPEAADASEEEPPGAKMAPSHAPKRSLVARLRRVSVGDDDAETAAAAYDRLVALRDESIVDDEPLERASLPADGPLTASR